MNFLCFFIITLTIFTGNAFCFEKEKIAGDVNPIAEIEVKELSDENLPTHSLIGSLADVLDEDETISSYFVERIKKKKNPIMSPDAEGLVYVNGQLCHEGHYPRTVIYTELAGPFYGRQTTMTYDRFVLYVNYDYKAEYTPGGVVLHHYYSDSEVITGSNQIIRFY